MTTRTGAANRVTWIGFFVNLALTAFKLVAGIVGHSGAMVADAIHSLSDLATDIVVLASFRLVDQPADRSHDYGHGKYETLATAVIGGSLLVVGVGVFWGGATKVWASLQGEYIAAPGGIAFVAAIVSMVVKEWLYRYSIRVGTRINSQAVIANAWHHRSDALSSLGTMLGIGGAIAFGEKWHILDPIAAILVSLLIVKVALEISSRSVGELCEESLDDAVENEILRIASADSAARELHNLRTRRIGSDIAIDLHVRVDPQMCVVDAHAIASGIEKRLRDRFGQATFVSVHVEPLLFGAKRGESAPSRNADQQPQPGK